MGVYIFAAVLGAGLLLLSMMGGDQDADGGAGDHGHGPDLGHGPAEFLLGFLRPRNLIFLLAAFGLTGTLLTLTGTARVLTLGASLAMGVGAMVLTHAVFLWLRRSESVIDPVGDADLEGSVARVVVPIRPGVRGRITCMLGGQEVQITAHLAPGAEGALEIGREAVVLKMLDGEAEIAPFDPPQLPTTSR